MPRSKLQDTRCKLNAARNHTLKAVTHIYDILPVDMNVNDWDEKYVELLRIGIQLTEMYHLIDDILNPEKVVNDAN